LIQKIFIKANQLKRFMRFINTIKEMFSIKPSKFRGRGIKLFIKIQPQIQQKQEREILQSLYDSLPDFFHGVEIYVYENKPEIDSTIIKVYAPEAKFELSIEEIISFYSNFIHDYLIYVYTNLSLKDYHLQYYNFALIYRIFPPELNNEFIPQPPENTFSGLLPSIDKIRNEVYLKAGEMASKIDVSNLPVTMEQINQLAIEKPTHWSYKFVKDPREMHYRSKSLSESIQQKYADCIKTCEEGLQHYHDSPYLMYMLGRSLGDLGENEKGIEVLTRVIEHHPNFADAYIERGRCKAQLKDIKGAKEDFSIAKEIEPYIELPRLLF
jgi:tetratricopeptide (TPR) repeat protein